MITLNVYFLTKENLVQSTKIDQGNVSTIDDARMLVIRNISKNYPDVRYKINIFTTFEGDNFINVFFEDNIPMKRDILIKNILSDRNF